jgi:hypothetical protein
MALHLFTPRDASDCTTIQKPGHGGPAGELSHAEMPRRAAAVRRLLQDAEAIGAAAEAAAANTLASTCGAVGASCGTILQETASRHDPTVAGKDWQDAGIVDLIKAKADYKRACYQWLLQCGLFPPEVVDVFDPVRLCVLADDIMQRLMRLLKPGERIEKIGQTSPCGASNRLVTQCLDAR